MATTNRYCSQANLRQICSTIGFCEIVIFLGIFFASFYLLAHEHQFFRRVEEPKDTMLTIISVFGIVEGFGGCIINSCLIIGALKESYRELQIWLYLNLGNLTLVLFGVFCFLEVYCLSTLKQKIVSYCGLILIFLVHLILQKAVDMLYNQVKYQGERLLEEEQDSQH